MKYRNEFYPVLILNFLSYTNESVYMYLILMTQVIARDYQYNIYLYTTTTAKIKR